MMMMMMMMMIITIIVIMNIMYCIPRSAERHTGVRTKATGGGRVAVPVGAYVACVCVDMNGHVSNTRYAHPIKVLASRLHLSAYAPVGHLREPARPRDTQMPPGTHPICPRPRPASAPTRGRSQNPHAPGPPRRPASAAAQPPPRGPPEGPPADP